MPSITKQALASDAAEIFDEVADDEVEWKGQTLQAKVTDLAISAQLSARGNTLDGDFTVRIRQAEFTGIPRPKVGDAVTYLGTRYAVKSAPPVSPSAPIFSMTLSA